MSSDLSNLSALISSLGSVERSGSGLSKDTDALQLPPARSSGRAQPMLSSTAPPPSPLAPPEKVRSWRGVPPSARTALSGETTAPSTSSRGRRGLLDCSKFDKPPDTDNWPQHVRDFKQQYESLEQNSVKLPVLRQLSPRSKKKLELMPPANAIDLTKAGKYEQFALAANTTSAYKSNTKKKCSSGKPPAKLQRLDSHGKFAQQPASATGLRLPEVVSAAPSQSYYTRFDEYRKKAAQQQQAYAALERSAAEAGWGLSSSKQANRDFNYPSNSQLLGMLTSASAPTSSSYNTIPCEDSVEEASPAGTTKGVLRAKDQYTPMVEEAVRIGKTLTQRQIHLDTELKESNSRIEEIKKGGFMDKWRGSLYDEIGLDVDPEFNRRRIFGNAWKTLAYYVRLFRMRAGLRLLHLQAKRATDGIRSNAGMFLSRILWGHRARMRVHALVNNLRLQREAEALHYKVEENYKLYNKIKIFKCCLSYRMRVKAARLALRMDAATSLQCLWRTVLATAKVCRLRVYFHRRTVCAIAVQAQYRRHYAARRVNFLRKYANVQRWESFEEVRRHDRMLRRRQHGAAYIICRFYKAYLLQKRLHTLIYWHHFELAIRIQRMARGYLARMRCRRQITRFRKIIRLKIRRVTIIQSLYRGKVGRRRALEAREKRALAQAKRRRKKAERLERIAQKSQFPRYSRKYLRWLHPFRYVYERKRAITIQRLWRGHRARRRRVIVAAMARVAAYFSRIVRRYQGAEDIQRVFRAYLVRKKFIVRRNNRMAIKIQTLYRMRLARKRVTHRRLYISASSLLYDMVSRLYLVRRYRLHFMHNLRLRVPIRLLQRTARLYIARKSRRALKDRKRFVADKRSSEALATYRALGCAQLALLRESMERPIGKRPTGDSISLCGRETRCLGPIQALFTHSITPGKALFDNASLANNRIDSTAVLKLMQKLNDVYAGKGVVGGKSKSGDLCKDTPKKNKKSDDELTFSLQECFDRRIILLPRTARKLYQNDVDVAFNKAKSGGGSILSFEDFCIFMQTVAVTVSEKAPTTDDISDDVDLRKQAAFSHDYFFPYHELLSDSSAFGIGFIATTLGTLLSLHMRKSNKSNTSQRVSSVAKVAADARESWICDVIQWLEDESRARVGMFVQRIQRMVRRHRSKHILQHAKAEIWRSTKQERLLAAHIKCQSLVRRFLTRVEVVKIAQLLLVRYVPHTGALYWHNPRTNVSTWEKPKILRDYDCVSIALPPPMLEYTIKCSNCSRVTAEVNCVNCGDSFCRNCFDSLHCKGKRRLHLFEKIPMCCRCHYQCATKNCATCTLRRPPKGSIEELVRGKRNFGNYCDTCFTHIHDAVDIGNTTSVLSRTVANELESGTIRDAYLVGQALHQRIITDHKFGDLVQPCEECQWRSAAWRCIDCDQVYCNKCLQGMHSMGGPFTKHTAERLPYYPPSLHRQTLTDSLAMRVAEKIQKIRREFARRVEHERIIYCVMLQTWWRMVYYGAKGKAILRQRRLLQRRAHGVRRYEDIHMRSMLEYRIRDVFGMAPSLKSDTREEKILKRFTVFRRQDIRRFIYQNHGDKFFVLKELEKLRQRLAAEAKGNIGSPTKQKYLSIRLPAAFVARPISRDANRQKSGTSTAPNSRPSTADMLAKNQTKGIAKAGFECGTESELLDQAKRGGWRLPGGVHMVTGQRKHETTMDLRPVLKRGEFARVKSHLFVVVEVGSNSVTLNRVWRENDCRSQRIYRLPSYCDDKWRLYYALQYKSFEVVSGNAISQVILGWQESIMGRIAEKLLERTKHHKKRGNMRASQFWGRRALIFQRRKALATNLLAEEIDVPTVKDHRNPHKTGTGTVHVDDDDSDDDEEIDDETRVKAARVVGKRWEATDREKMERGRAEKVLSREELAADSIYWEEHLDPMTNQTYYQDKETWEYMYTIPKSVDARRSLDAEAIERQKSFESAKQSAKSSLSKKRR